MIARVAPSVRRISAEAGVDPADIPGTGKGGRATKADAMAYVNSAPASKSAPPAKAEHTPRELQPNEERVRMTRLRQTIARRLKEAQDTAAMLTTFNDVDMGQIMDLRKEYKESFLEKHGVKLGFMGFFTKAVCSALKEIPAVNAEIDGTDIIYKNHFDIGMAVGTDKGLVVPVIRDADQLSLAGIERELGVAGEEGARWQARNCRHAGRHIHHHEWRCLWLVDVDANPQSAAVRRARLAPDREAPGRHQ